MADNKIERVIKMYINRGRRVFIVETVHGYSFKIQDQCTKKDYFSRPYESLHECENDSYKVVKNV